MNIKDHLSGKSKEDLINEIFFLVKTYSIVHDYYENKLGDNTKVLNKFKDMIEAEFFPKKGFGKARAGNIRTIISNFKKVSNSKSDLVELLIFHVEQGVQYTNTYGDIDEKFYSSIESSFQSAMNHIQSEKLNEIYQDRCLEIVNDTKNIGWGFHDCLSDLYHSLYKHD